MWQQIARGATTTGLAAWLACGTATAFQPAKPPPQTPVKPPVPATQPPPPAPPATAQIGGTIKSAVDDAPLARARVIAMADALPEARAAITGSDGTYVLSDLPPGSYTVSATRTGYAAQIYGQGRAMGGTPVAVATGVHLGNVDISLSPGGVIVGRILDEDGTPFAGAVVEALITRFDAGTDTLFSVSGSQTDDRGEFRLFGLGPGQYYVSAQDPAFRSVSSPKGVLHYSPTYYPGTPFADQARTVGVTGTGDPPKIEFRLKLVAPARVSGQLIAYDGKQLISGAVIMSPLEGEGVPMVPPEDISIQPDGRFVFGHVVPGRYQIRARGQSDPAGAALFAVFSTEVLGNDIADIRMTLRAGAILDGTLSLENKHGSKPPQLSTLRVRAPFVDGNNFGDALTGTVQPDGTFALRGIMTGAHQLVLDGIQPPWTLKRVSLRGGDITDLEIDVSEKEQIRDVRITITDAASEVSGTVRNARNVPVADTGVIVFPKVPLFWMRTNRRMRVTYTDREGRFSVPGLPAGEYLAVASPTIDESDLGRHDRLRALQAIAVPFRLASDEERATLMLRLAVPPPAPVVR